MLLAVLLSLAASLCTATSSVCQRLGAASLPPPKAAARDGQAGDGTESPPRRRRGGDFDPLLVFRLARRPVWLLGFAGMLAGFACQVTALRYGPLALVQPILAVELLFVFAYLAALHPGAVRPGDWLAAFAMSAGVALFLAAASPSGGQEHATATAWWTAAIATALAVSAAIGASRMTVAGGTRPASTRPASTRPASTRPASASPAWRAACLGIATGIAWGFVAAIIKELSSHLAGGPPAIFTTWAPYALMAAGAAAMLLTAHAMTAGPLAASQPGFTILDPLTATLLGLTIYNEHLRTTPVALTAECAALLALAFGVRTLARSALISPAPASSPTD